MTQPKGASWDEVKEGGHSVARSLANPVGDIINRLDGAQKWADEETRKRQAQYYAKANDTSLPQGERDEAKRDAAFTGVDLKALSLAAELASTVLDKSISPGAGVTAAGSGISVLFDKSITPGNSKGDDAKDESEVESGDENSPLTLSPHQPTADPALTMNPHQPTVNPDLTVNPHQPKPEPEPNSPVGQSLLHAALAALQPGSSAAAGAIAASTPLAASKIEPVTKNISSSPSFGRKSSS